MEAEDFRQAFTRIEEAFKEAGIDLAEATNLDGNLHGHQGSGRTTSRDGLVLTWGVWVVPGVEEGTENPELHVHLYDEKDLDLEFYLQDDSHCQFLPDEALTGGTDWGYYSEEFLEETVIGTWLPLIIDTFLGKK